MKFFEDKSIFQKIAISILLILVFSFAVPKNVEAKSGDGLGGKLLHPVVSLVIAIGDGVLDVFHSAILNQDTTLLAIDTTSNIWNKIGAFLLAAVVVIAIGVAIYLTAGGAVAALVAAIPGAATAGGIAGTAAGVITLIVIQGTTGAITSAGGAVYNLAYMNDTICLPLYSITPEEIFSGKLAIFDADFFNPSKETTTNDDGEAKHLSIAYKLRSTISTWYFTIRNIAIVASLSILVYVGIRILISSTAADKSKYKQMLNDWIISLCLIFAMHYIMSFSNLLVKRVSGLLNSVDKTAYINYVFMDEEKSKTILKGLEEEENKQILYKYGIVKEGGSVEEALIADHDGEKVLVWPTNMMGMVRMQAQVANKENSVTFAGYTVMFLVLVIFTISFAFTYFRRILYMAFLTLLAPLVAMTYALDKLKDGSAQGFNNWFKEYMVNLIIQPVHLLLYTVLVTSAIEIATENVIYGIVAIGFLIPAEKLVRKFFKIEETQTQGLLAGPAGAALVMTGLNRLLGHRPGGRPEMGKGGKSQEDENNRFDDSIRENFDEDNTLFGGPSTGAATGTGADSGTNVDSGNQTQNDNNDQSINIPQITGNTGNNTPVPSVGTGIPGIGANSSTDSEDGTSSRSSSGPFEGIKNKAQSVKDKIENNRHVRRALSMPVVRGALGAAKYFGKNQHSKMQHRKAIRMVAGAATGLAAAGLGAAAGIASGDIKNVYQNAAAAGFAGYKFGEGVPEAIEGSGRSTLEGTKGAIDAFQKGYMGEEEYNKEQKKKIREKQRKELEKDDEFKKQLSRKLGSEQKAKEAMENDDIMTKAIQYGLTDVADIAALYQRTHEDSVIDGKTVARASNTNQAVAEIKYLKRAGISKDTSKMGHKDREDFRNSVKDRITRTKGTEATDEEVNNYVNRFDATSRILFGK